MIEQKYIIHQNQSLLEALTQINDLREGPLVLFAIDEEERMVGTVAERAQDHDCCGAVPVRSVSG